MACSITNWNILNVQCYKMSKVEAKFEQKFKMH